MQSSSQSQPELTTGQRRSSHHHPRLNGRPYNPGNHAQGRPITPYRLCCSAPNLSALTVHGVNGRVECMAAKDSSAARRIRLYLCAQHKGKRREFPICERTQICICWEPSVFKCPRSPRGSNRGSRSTLWGWSLYHCRFILRCGQSCCVPKAHSGWGGSVTCSIVYSWLVEA